MYLTEEMYYRLKIIDCACLCVRVRERACEHNGCRDTTVIKSIRTTIMTLGSGWRKRETSGKELQIKGKLMTVLTSLVTLLAMMHILVTEYVITFVTLL